MKTGVHAREHLKATYYRFMSEADPARRIAAGKELIREIFGKEALADRDENGRAKETD
jgi:hypothetical protein